MTIGQYLQPTRKHHPVVRFITPDEFKSYATIGKTKGFLHMASSPLTRSSHHAGDDFEKLKAARAAKLAQDDKVINIPAMIGHNSHATELAHLN